MPNRTVVLGDLRRLIRVVTQRAGLTSGCARRDYLRMADSLAEAIADVEAMQALGAIEHAVNAPSAEAKRA